MLYTVLLIASVFAAVVPMVGFLALVWWLDRYEREPIWMVALTFFWGGLVATFFSLAGNTALHLLLAWILGDEAAATVTPVAVAPLVEEPAKALVLLLVTRSRQFDNTTDGFVYGAAAGFGFGMTENFLYFSTAAITASFDPVGGTLAWLGTVAARTAYSAVMHATTTSFVGACFGFVRYRGWLSQAGALLVGMGVGMGIHALWNGLLTVDAMVKSPVSLTLVDFILFPFIFLGMMGLFQLCTWNDRRTIEGELRQEAEDRGTLPLEHVTSIASYRLRNLSRFAPPGIDQAAYIRAATTLAFRRQQCRVASGRWRGSLDADLDRLRREVSGLLAAS
jgi:RsiW-degrading membrane proteinase PrsW (M82 family)